MISIKEYARTRGISREAVRKQLQRYSKELEGHVTTQNRTKFFDAYAEDFLDDHRLQRTVVIEPTDEETEKELNKLKNELNLLRTELSKKQDKIIELLEGQNNLLEIKGRYEALIEDKESSSKHMQEQLNEMKDRLDKAEAESKSYYKSIFGFYRKSAATTSPDAE